MRNAPKFIYLSLVVFLLLIGFHGNALAEDDAMLKAFAHYRAAYKHFKEDRKSNLENILSELQKARDLIIHREKEPKVQSLLVKINALVYWANKFSTIDQSNKASTFSSNQDGRSPPRKRSSPKKPEKVSVAGSSVKLRELKKKESNRAWNESDSLHSLMSKYENEVDMDVAKKIQNAIEKSYQKDRQKTQHTLTKLLSKISQHDELLKNRKYDELSSKVKQLLKSSNLNDTHSDILYDYYIEKYVLSKIVDKLKSSPDQNIRLEESKLINFESFISDIDDSGIEFRSLDLRASVHLNWHEIDERMLFKIGQSIFSEQNKKERTYLAITLFGMGKYQDSFDLFKKVIDDNPDRFDLFASYLTKCEINYRIETSSMIEKVYVKSQEYLKQKKFDKAIKFLSKFKQKVLSQSLGGAFQNRLSQVTKAIVSEDIY